MDEDNLIVNDEDYRNLAEAYRSLGALFEEKYHEYISCLTTILENAITDGSVAQNLRAFVSAAGLLEGRMREVLDGTAVLCEAFTADVNVADDFLYW